MTYYISANEKICCVEEMTRGLSESKATYIKRLQDFYGDLLYLTDNIEELFDEVVGENYEDYTILHDKKDYKDYNYIYGARRTTNGLMFVAKLINGKWEIL